MCWTTESIWGVGGMTGPLGVKLIKNLVCRINKKKISISNYFSFFFFFFSFLGSKSERVRQLKIHGLQGWFKARWAEMGTGKLCLVNHLIIQIRILNFRGFFWKNATISTTKEIRDAWHQWRILYFFHHKNRQDLFDLQTSKESNKK